MKPFQLVCACLTLLLFYSLGHAVVYAQMPPPDYVGDVDPSIDQLYEESKAKEQAGNLEQALALAKKIYDRGESFEIVMRIGWLNYKLGRHDIALLYYKRATVLSPKSDDARLGVMLPLMAQERWIEARPWGENVLADSPENIWAHRYMALICYMLEDYSCAEMHYRKAKDAQPDDALMALGLGLTLVQTGKLEEGRALCQQASPSFPNDPRVSFCLSVSDPSWTIVPQIFGMGGFYTDAWDKREFASAFVGLEVTAPVGFGFILDFAYAWIRQRYEPVDYKQYTPGSGIFYSTDTDLYWFHYAALIDNEKNDSHVLAFHAMHKWEMGLGFGGDLAVGIYNGFQTVQLAPELKYEIIPEVAIRFYPMLQIRLGSIDRGMPMAGRRNLRLRGSGEIGFDFNLPYTELSVSGYYGQRWYTVENKGLFVWNSDDDLVAGMRMILTLFPKEIVSGTLIFGHDYADHQFGKEHRYHIIGFMAGLRANF